MNTEQLTQAVKKAKEQTRQALQTVYDTLNQGQKKKLVKDEGARALFDLYGVEYEEWPLLSKKEAGKRIIQLIASRLK